MTGGPSLSPTELTTPNRQSFTRTYLFGGEVLQPATQVVRVVTRHETTVPQANHGIQQIRLVHQRRMSPGGLPEARDGRVYVWRHDIFEADKLRCRVIMSQLVLSP